MLEQFLEQKKIEEREIKIKISKYSLKKIIESYQSILNIGFRDSMGLEDIGEYYKFIVRSIYNIHCSREDISSFTKYMFLHENDKHYKNITGLFLSALINISSEYYFTLELNNLHTPINYIGFNNNKNYMISGSVNKFGFKMKYGTMQVVISDIEKPKIEAGQGMTGGRINIIGNISKDSSIGQDKTGGDIKLFPFNRRNIKIFF